MQNFELVTSNLLFDNATIKSALQNTPNLLIKGNNLLALHTLKKRKDIYGQIKLIYIDPPYNTGNDSFNYNDKFNHSAWLCFMKNRLEIAKEFLRDDGVIFVQCDDNEQAYLKVLMDEIFGVENFVSCFIRQTRKGGGSMSKFVSIDHDYIIMYCKNKSNVNRFYASYSDEYLKRYNESDEKGKYFWDTFARNRQGSSNVYDIEMPDGSLKNGAWIYKKEKYEELKMQGEIQIKKLKDGYTIQVKQRLNAEGQIARSLILDSPNQQGTQEAVVLFGREKFTYPKPEALLKRIIEISTQENDLVMDFFAGSGTTCAVAHKMNRRWVGIEQMDYIKTITKERLKKIVEGEQGGISKAVNFVGGGEFVYVELMPLNAVFKEQIQASNDESELEQLYKDLQEKAFVDYRVDIKEMLKDKDFEALNLDEKKRILLSVLDSNMDYVPLSEIKDSEYGISSELVELNNAFFKGGEDE